ncbi:MAG: heme exporter protein CcmB [Acidobacteriaceae bacterium]|jgi:heme exporter protein CcmB|nr:heme exporter protein CcmB [Acidobacteriaceae bacterium]
MFFRTALLVLRKDVAIELRSYEIVSTTVFFALSCVAILSFAFVNEGQAPEGTAAGILWIAIAFSGTLALGRTFERERYGETLKALLLAPAPRPAIYLGKMLGIVALMLATEIVLVPMVNFLFAASLFARPGLLVVILLLGTVGYASVGTLFAAMLVRARTRDVMLPILLYPITVPVIIAGVRGTSALIASPVDDAVAQLWISLLAFFDVVFVTLALWTFEPLMTE